MSRKRRIFDIEVPEDDPQTVDETPIEGTARGGRRGPMASAISENAGALKARKEMAEKIRAENDSLAHEYVALKEAGQVVERIPLDQVHSQMLIRDRIPGEDKELADLIVSIRETGLSNPIRAIARPDGLGWELVQGYRRLSAYRALLDETGDQQWMTIPALILPGEADIAGLYRRMVDENIVRKDLSFAEMAHAAKSYAEDPATEAADLSEAVAALFQSAPYSKRSYIRSFAYLMEQLGDDLAYPTEIPRALGVKLARDLKERADLVGTIRQELREAPGRSIEVELDILRRNADLSSSLSNAEVQEQNKSAKAARKHSKQKTTFHIQSKVGAVKCTAGDGRLEIRLDRDFSAIDRARLEKAISSLVDGLE